MKLSFVRGHCGWDAATLLLAEEISVRDDLEVALQVLDLPDSGLEVGLLHEQGDDIRVRVVANPERTWISMCGGITQLVGKALVDTKLGQNFPIEWSNGAARVNLIMDSGVMPITIGAGPRTVTTEMGAYAAWLYRLGVVLVEAKGVACIDTGEFLVIHIKDLQMVYPGIDFTRRDAGPHLDIVNALMREHRRDMAMLWDTDIEQSGDYRLFSRFLDEASASNPYEFQCGTGTVAMLLAFVYVNVAMKGSFSHKGNLIFEWGNSQVTEDPYGVRTSTVDYEIRNGRVAQVSYSHSVIEVVAEGMLDLS